MIRDQEAIFNEIYAKERWGKGKGSGTGSDPKYCEKYLDYLRLAIKATDVKSVLDIGCGDGQLYADFDWSGVEYTGCDISAEALALHRNRAPKRKVVKVSGIYGTIELVYETAPDLIIIKDVMQHWTDEEIGYFLRELSRTNGWKYIVTANNWKFHRDPSKNGQPRVLDRYSWAPIPVDYPAFVNFGFKPIFRYPKGGFKQVMLAMKGDQE